ncbi:MAG: aldo/keto reductase [Deltaproteobacteria bacterium]|nr:aldo/keto reductase [Deltaproteobacteria bacterium]
MNVSVVSFGCWAIGGGFWGRVEDNDSIKAIHRAIDLGVNLFDTAPIYGFGHSEEVLGRALEGKRDKVYIATKCGPKKNAAGDIFIVLSRDSLIKECEVSLKRLRTDFIDLYQIHWLEDDSRISEGMETLDYLKSQGKIRAVGVSNFSVSQMKEALKTARFESLQPPYNIMNREIEDGIAPFCKKNNIGLIVYDPLARGLLTGKFGAKEPVFEKGDVRNYDRRFRGGEYRKNIAFVEEMKKEARSLGMTTAQYAVAWILKNEAVTSAICGAKTAAQIVETAAAGETTENI